MWEIAAQFGIPAGFELVIILIIIAILLLFGPQKIPELARGLGKALGEFRRGKAELEKEVSTEISAMNAKDARQRIERTATSLGVATSGRSESQIKLDIARAVDKASDDQVAAAAQSMGVYSKDADVQRLKEQIIKALNV